MFHLAVESLITSLQCLGREDQKGWSDFTLHIDGVSGRKRSYFQFLSRVEDGATALGAPVSSGGLGLQAEAGEMVGLLGPNNMVSLIAALIFPMLIQIKRITSALCTVCSK